MTKISNCLPSTVSHEIERSLVPTIKSTCSRETFSPAVIVQAADAISAARPGARREDLENYIKRLQKLEEITYSFPGVDKAYAIQAGREVRIAVKPEIVSDEQMVVIAHDIVKKIESELEYPGQIKVHLIRESRAIDYAK